MAHGQVLSQVEVLPLSLCHPSQKRQQKVLWSWVGWVSETAVSSIKHVLGLCLPNCLFRRCGSLACCSVCVPPPVCCRLAEGAFGIHCPPAALLEL